MAAYSPRISSVTPSAARAEWERDQKRPILPLGRMPGWRTWISLEDKEHAQELLLEQHSYRHELQRDSRHDFATKRTGPASYSFKQTPSSRRPSSAALADGSLTNSSSPSESVRSRIAARYTTVMRIQRRTFAQRESDHAGQQSCSSCGVKEMPSVSRLVETTKDIEN